MRSYYEILGVSENASKEEIKSRYHKLALQMHPDKLSRDKSKSEKEKKEILKNFQEITNAYETLSDADRRKKYDFERKNSFFGGRGSQQVEFEGGFENESIFDEIFGSFFGGRSRNKKNSDAPKKGEDILINLTISFKQLVLGVEKDLKLDLLRSCYNCSQTGAFSKDHIQICSTCDGQGIVNVIQRSIFGNVRTQTTCSTCKGKGKKVTKKCDLCKGSKFLVNSEVVSVKIPRGVKPGQKIVIRGKGNDGLYSSERGIIYVEVNVKKHQYFERKNDDIHVSLPISFIDAILGKRVKVITIEGIEEVDIPKCSQIGDCIILKNKGFYTEVGKNIRGNLYVWLQINLPKKIGKKIEDIFINLYEDTSWNPNEDFINNNGRIVEE